MRYDALMRRTACLSVLLIALAAAAAPPAAEEQADRLRTILQQADEAYFKQHDSIMADEAYDALRAQYAALAAAYPDLEPYTCIGAEPDDASRTVEHQTPIRSLKKAYDDEALLRFVEQCGTNELYCIEPKIDGLTIVLRYRGGRLAEAATRGNGKTGQNVTAALAAAECIPLKLNNASEDFYVRGEVFMPLAAFDALNKRRICEGKEPLKSPRNTAAGTLRLLDHAEIARRGIQVRIFELLDADEVPETHTAALQLIKEAGLPVIESRTVKGSDVCRTVHRMNPQRTAYPFAADGVVIKLDNRAAFRQLGSTALYPRGAIARKYRTRPISTRLLRVEWSTGSSGKLTPIAYFEPVQFNGAVVESATLHNLNHLRALDLMIGDSILVIRAGGAVPQIIGVETEKRTGKETPIRDPQ